jgi:hypothetical protein
MIELSHASSRLTLNAVNHMDERASRQRRLLCPAHLRRGHHLHGLGDLSSAADGPYSTPQIAWAIHSATLHIKFIPKFL